VTEQLILELAMVIVTAAALAVVAHFSRQPLIVAYIAAGIVFGPHSPVPALRLVTQSEFIRGTGELGLVLLLFLLGIVLHPGRLLQIFRQASLVTLCTSLAFFLVGFGVTGGVVHIASGVYSLTWIEKAFIGCAMAFSSTLLVVKLLPTRRLHESEVGTLAIGILIIQDLIAIIVLLVMGAAGAIGAGEVGAPWRLPLGIVMLVAAFFVEQHGVRRLMHHAQGYPELLFVMSLGWCLLLAEGAEHLGFSREIGAFVAGLALARSPLSLYIWEKVSPLRDFFIVLLFFSLGALVNLESNDVVGVVLLAALLALVLALAKPYLFRLALRISGARPALAREAGWRLGQTSEFGLVIAFLALDQGLIGRMAFELILIAMLLSFLVSTYVVVLKYPSPLGVTEAMHQA
jgi:Kef-type K+ transport system membrane component KefB